MKTIDTETLREHFDDYTIINVLPEKYYKKWHIKGSTNIPIDEDDFEEQVEQAAGSKDAPIVVYCANYDCKASGDAWKRLDEAGFTKVKAYEGGTQEWKEAGYPLGGASA